MRKEARVLLASVDSVQLCSYFLKSSSEKLWLSGPSLKADACKVQLNGFRVRIILHPALKSAHFVSNYRDLGYCSACCSVHDSTPTSEIRDWRTPGLVKPVPHPTSSLLWRPPWRNILPKGPAGEGWSNNHFISASTPHKVQGTRSLQRKNWNSASHCFIFSFKNIYHKQKA